MIAQRACVLPLENGYCPLQAPAAGDALGHGTWRQRGRRQRPRIVAPHVDLRLQRERCQQPLVFAKHGIDPGRGRAAFNKTFDDARKQRIAELKAAEAARLGDAQDADAVEVGDGLSRHVSRGDRYRGASGKHRDQRSRLLQQIVFHRLHQQFMPRTASQTARVTSTVVALPPRSGVMMPAAHDLLHRAHQPRGGRLSRRDAPASRTPVQKVATGLAMPLPVMSNAEPWIGSNIDGKRRSGSMLRGRRDAEAAGQRGGEVGQDVGVQVGRDDGVEGPRLAAPCAWSSHRPASLSQVTSGKSVATSAGDLVPHHHPVALRVGLGDDGEQLARARLRERRRRSA